MLKDKKQLASKKVIADLFGVTARRIEQLVADGIIEGVGKPQKFDLFLTVELYIKFLSDKAHNKTKKPDDEVNESIKIEAEARLKTAKAEVAELELKEVRGELHKAEDVEEIMSAHVMHIRSMLNALPGKLAVDLSELETSAEIATRLKKEVNYILSDLSEFEYDEKKFAKKVRERNKWSDSNHTKD